MSEKPRSPWSQEKNISAVAESEQITIAQLTAKKNAVLESAPQDWDSAVDNEKIIATQASLKGDTLDTLLAYLSIPNLLRIPTFAKAVIKEITERETGSSE